MICPKCNSEIKDGSKFCTNCGEPLPQMKKCVECGALIKEQALFCTSCGAKQPVKEDKPKVDEKKTVSEQKPVSKKDVTLPKEESKQSAPKEEPKQKPSVQKPSTTKKKNSWIPILVTAILIGIGYFVKQGKSESKEENTEHTTSTESNSNVEGLMSESDIRSSLCNYVFIDEKGNRIFFTDNANVLVYNGNNITTSLTIQNQKRDETDLSIQGAELHFQGANGSYFFYCIIGEGKASILDKGSSILYISYTFEEASRISMDDAGEGNAITWKDFYNDYVFGNKDFSNIAHTLCTPKLIQFLKDAYNQEYECLDGECYAMWLFRTGNQDGVSDVSKVTNITDEGDGWFKVSYIDMGIEGATYIKFVSYNGRDYMDEIRRAY